MSPQIHIAEILKYKLQKNINTTYINAEIQYKEIQQIILLKYRNRNYRNTDIHITEIEITNIRKY